MASRLTEWSLIAAFPAGIFLLLGLLELPLFADPCHEWGAGTSASSGTLAAPSSCVGYTSTPETRMQAATRLLLFQGTTLIGLTVALVGAARDRPLLVGVGAGLLASISLPLMTGRMFLLPLASAALLGGGLAWFRRPLGGRGGGPGRGAGGLQ